MSINRVIPDGDASKVEDWETPQFSDSATDKKEEDVANLKHILNQAKIDELKKQARFAKPVVASEDLSRIGVWDQPEFHEKAETHGHLTTEKIATSIYTREEFEALGQSSKTFNKVNPTEEFSKIALWDLPIFAEDESGEMVEIVPETIKMPTAEDLEEVQRHAREEAYKEGMAQGQADGFEQGKKEGYEAGLAEGKQQGRDEAYAEVKPQLDEQAAQFKQVFSTLTEPLKDLDYEVEQQLVSMAMAVARHLVRRELKTDTGQVVAAVRQAVSTLPINTRNIRVYLHPEDASLVRENLSVTDEAEEEQRWKIVEDPALTRGGCNVETEHSRIDATVETRLAAIIAQALGGDREGDNE